MSGGDPGPVRRDEGVGQAFAGGVVQRIDRVQVTVEIPAVVSTIATLRCWDVSAAQTFFISPLRLARIVPLPSFHPAGICEDGVSRAFLAWRIFSQKSGRGATSVGTPCRTRRSFPGASRT